MQRVADEHAWWGELGGPPFDPRERLPVREYEAHLAIMEGKQKERKKQRRKQEREARKAQQKV